MFKILNSNYVNDNQDESLYWNILIDVTKVTNYIVIFKQKKI